MATNTFKRKLSSSIGTTATAVGSYAVVMVIQTTVIGLACANITSSQVAVSAYLETSGGDVNYLIKDAPIPAGSSLVIIGVDQKVVMELSDQLKIVSDTASSVEAVMSILEIDTSA